VPVDPNAPAVVHVGQPNIGLHVVVEEQEEELGQVYYGWGTGPWHMYYL
jgi:hypothetical protein